jgi:hypothetical protein
VAHQILAVKQHQQVIKEITAACLATIQHPVALNILEPVVAAELVQLADLELYTILNVVLKD